MVMVVMMSVLHELSVVFVERCKGWRRILIYGHDILCNIFILAELYHVPSCHAACKFSTVLPRLLEREASSAPRDMSSLTSFELTFSTDLMTTDLAEAHKDDEVCEIM